MPQRAEHLPVLLREALDLLAPGPGATIVDATLGAGGHAEALLEAVGAQGRVVGIDRDPAALAAAGRRLARFGGAFIATHGDHRELAQLLGRLSLPPVDGVLFDLGLSSMQLADDERGFSFQNDGPLDMRMDPGSGPSAADLLATLSEEDLRLILWRFGEERDSRAIARAIARERALRPLTRTSQLAELVESARGPVARRYRIHPATRTFQALRIAVNGELEGLEETIIDAVSLLRPGGRIAAIAFHSLEDRAVKHALRSQVERCICPPRLPHCGCGRQSLIRILTPRPIRPSEDEIARNPRARSSKLRAAEKL